MSGHVKKCVMLINENLPLGITQIITTRELRCIHHIVIKQDALTS